MVNDVPEPTLFNPLKLLMICGVSLNTAWVPSPSAPKLKPKPHTALFASTIHVRPFPAKTAFTPVKFGIVAGFGCGSEVLPCPSGPEKLLPHAQTVPSDFNANT